MKNRQTRPTNNNIFSGELNFNLDEEGINLRKHVNLVLSDFTTYLEWDCIHKQVSEKFKITPSYE